MMSGQTDFQRSHDDWTMNHEADRGQGAFRSICSDSRKPISVPEPLSKQIAWTGAYLYLFIVPVPEIK